jgi:hypothetical protein
VAGRRLAGRRVAGRSEARRDPRWDAPAAVLARDASALVRSAADQLGLEPLSSQLVRVHHRPGRSAARVERITVSVGGEREERLLVVLAHRRPLVGEVLEISVDGQPVAVWLYPNDPRLPGLALAADRHRVRALLDRHDLPPGEVHLRRRAYRPTRRAVVEVTVGSGGRRRPALFLKVLRPRRARDLAATHRVLATAVAVPPVIEHDEHGVVALASVAGVSLRRALVAGDPVPDPAALVAQSRALAPIEVPAVTDPTRFADPAPQVRALVADRPDLADEVVALVEAAGDAGGPIGTVHGDLHGGQVLVDQGRIAGLIDLDGVGTGRLAHDAGNLVAHVGALSERHPGAADRVGAYAERVADAYRELVGSVPMARATAGAWLALAASAHRRRDERAVRRRIDRAAGILEGRRG